MGWKIWSHFLLKIILPNGRFWQRKDSLISNWPVPGYVHTAIRESTESNSAKVRMKPDGASLQDYLLIPFVSIFKSHLWSIGLPFLAPLEYMYAPIEFLLLKYRQHRTAKVLSMGFDHSFLIKYSTYCLKTSPSVGMRLAGAFDLQWSLLLNMTQDFTHEKSSFPSV